MGKIFNFAGVSEKRYSELSNSKAVIIQVPYDSTVTYRKGAKFGPAAIIDASCHMEKFDEELNKETYKIGIHTQRPLSVARLDAEKMVKVVEKAVYSVIDKDKFPVILGGEHTAAIGAVRAFSNRVQHFSILQLDAHCDLRDEYQHSKYNHACVARRMLECASIVQVGIRSISKYERDFLPHPKIRQFDAYHIRSDKDWAKNVVKTLSENVYVTIDLDVFDPGAMPSTGTPEPGGLGWYDIITLLHMLAKKKHIIGFDVVELCPAKDQEFADFLAAKLVYRFLGYIFDKK